MVGTQMNTDIAPGGRDLRRNPRYKLDVRVRLIIRNDKGNQVIHGRGTDISETGMAIFVPHQLSVEDRAEMEFTLPYSRQPQRVIVHVRNRSGYRYGVEFMTLSMPQRDEIIKTCKTLTLLQ